MIESVGGAATTENVKVRQGMRKVHYAVELQITSHSKAKAKRRTESTQKNAVTKREIRDSTAQTVAAPLSRAVHPQIHAKAHFNLSRKER